MALRAVPDHPKFAELKARLGSGRGATLGYLEAIWHFCGRFTPQGNIGKYTDLQIEAWVEWDGAPGALIAALVDSHWIDRDATHRLLVHDWHEHADGATKIALKRKGLQFLRSLPQCQNTVATVSALPEPEPEAVPEPEPSQSRGPVLVRTPADENADSHPSGKVSPVTVPPERNRAETIRDLLGQYVEQFGLQWGPPDDRIVREVDAATRASPVEHLDEVLCSLLDRKRKPRNWRYLGAMVISDFEARAKANAFRRHQTAARSG